MDAKVNVSTRAYCKMLLHAAKYPHCAINGVLLAEKPKSKEVKSVNFVDAIPLFHLSLSLAPMMEIALIQVDEYCKTHSLVIGGYYHANLLNNDNSLKILVKRICAKIQENNTETDTIICMIDNSAMSLDCPKEAIQLYKYGAKDWEKRSSKECLEEGALAVTSSLLHSNAQTELVDFDNHLYDLTQDWTNLDVNEMITRCS